MTRYRVRAKYAVLDDLPLDPEAVLLSDAELESLHDRLSRGEEPRPFSVEVNGTPVVVNGRLIYEAWNRVTTGGRPPGRDLAKRGPALLKARTDLGSAISQEALAEKLGVTRSTVQRYFRLVHCVPGVPAVGHADIVRR